MSSPTNNSRRSSIFSSTTQRDEAQRRQDLEAFLRERRMTSLGPKPVGKLMAHFVNGQLTDHYAYFSLEDRNTREKLHWYDAAVDVRYFTRESFEKPNTIDPIRYISCVLQPEDESKIEFTFDGDRDPLEWSPALVIAITFFPNKIKYIDDGSNQPKTINYWQMIIFYIDTLSIQTRRNYTTNPSDFMVELTGTYGPAETDRHTGILASGIRGDSTPSQSDYIPAIKSFIENASRSALRNGLNGAT